MAGLEALSLDSNSFSEQAGTPPPADAPETLDVPELVLENIFGRLDGRQVAVVASVCRLWRNVSESNALWRKRAEARWSCWDSKPADDEVAWKEVCELRAKQDADVGRLVGDMCWPQKMGASQREFKAMGLDARERLLELCESESVGTQHFAKLALSWAELGASARTLLGMSDAELEARPECAARAIAQVLCPTEDLSWLPIYLDKLAKELHGRLIGHAILGDRHPDLAVRHLNHFLFGAPAPLGVRTWEHAGDTLEYAAGDGVPDWVPKIPQEPWGMGLGGSSSENYYTTENSLIHKVFLNRKGIPITLAVIHAAVGRRCKIPIHAINLPCHFLNSCGVPGDAAEEFVDCFRGAQGTEDHIMTRQQVQEMLESGFGVPFDPAFLRPVPVLTVFRRMCNNITHVLHKIAALQGLHLLLSLGLAMQPNDLELRQQCIRVTYGLGQYDTALQNVILAHDTAPSEGTKLHFEAIRRQIETDRAQAIDSAMKQRHRTEALEIYVGDVVRHRVHGWIGVVVSWDLCDRDVHGGGRDRSHVPPIAEGSPVCTVLVDDRCSNTQGCPYAPQPRSDGCRYVSQDNLEVMNAQSPAVIELCGWSDRFSGANTFELQHSDVGEFFERRHPTRMAYVPNAYLRHRFPDDAAARL